MSLLLIILGMMTVGAFAEDFFTGRVTSSCGLLEYRLYPNHAGNNEACELQLLNLTSTILPDRSVTYTRMLNTDTAKIASISSPYTAANATWSTASLQLPAQENSTFMVWSAWCRNLATFMACAGRAFEVVEATNEGRAASAEDCKAADGCQLTFAAHTKAGNQSEVRIVATSYQNAIYGSDLQTNTEWIFGYTFVSSNVPTVRVTWGIAPAVVVASSEPLPGPSPPSPQPLATGMPLPWGPLPPVMLLLAAVLHLLLRLQ